MKVFATIILPIAVYLLYRIAYPKQVDRKTDGDVLPQKPKSVPDVIGKSRFVLSEHSKPRQTPTTNLETEKRTEKDSTFAAETEEKRSAVIPPDELNEVFGNEPNPEDLDIPPDEEDDEEVDWEKEEEAEEMNRMLGHETEVAEGVDFDDLQKAAKIVKEQPKPETVSEEIVRTLTAVEHTDMFEMMVSGDEGTLNWIKSVIDSNVQRWIPETETGKVDMDYGDFDISDFLN
jgi:hypothetical protein